MSTLLANHLVRGALYNAELDTFWPAGSRRSQREQAQAS